MIKPIDIQNIPEGVKVIKDGFITVANELGFTAENAPRFTAFAISEERLNYQLENEHRQMTAYYLDNGRIIGYYSLWIQDNDECELNNLCVVPEQRHNGIGGALLKDAFERAKKADCIKMNIGIVEENKVLRKWYEDNGFVHIGTKKFDFFPFTCGYMEKNL